MPKAAPAAKAKRAAGSEEANKGIHKRPAGKEAKDIHKRPAGKEAKDMQPAQASGPAGQDIRAAGQDMQPAQASGPAPPGDASSGSLAGGPPPAGTDLRGPWPGWERQADFGILLPPYSTFLREAYNSRFRLRQVMHPDSD